MILAGKFPYNEMGPETLQRLCQLAGFEHVEWTAHTELFDDPEVLNFFQRRLDALLKEIPVESLRAGFSETSAELRAKASQVGGMEIPFYRLRAEKTSP